MPVSLSDLLKESTAAAHQQAESSPFVGELLDGKLDAEAVGALTAQLYVIYRDMEATAQAHYSQNPLLAGFLDPALERTGALEADMAYHHGADWQGKLDGGVIAIVPATRTYSDAITNGHSAEFLLANHYVRLLGDLSGGQIIHRMVQRQYGIPDAGLNFYLFPAIGKIKPYKDAYRQRLDDLDLDEAGRAAVVGHAQRIFAYNGAVFTDLYAAVGDKQQGVA